MKPVPTPPETVKLRSAALGLLSKPELLQLLSRCLEPSLVANKA